jgi:hypothetical protein
MSGYPQAIRSVAVRERAGAVVTFPLALLLPSFGVVVFAVTLAQVLFLAQGAQALFRDSDTGWHIRNGESILESLTLPKVDHFSYTRQGQPWFAWEWLSDAAYAGAYRVAGLSGVALLAALSIALTIWGAARLALSLGANLFFTAGAVVVLSGTSSIHWLARPHLFSWLLALAFIGAAEHARRGQSRWLYILPLLACIWANIHGSFLLGPAILFAYAVGAWLAASATSLRFVATCLISLLATFINPYGSRLHDHVLTYLQTDYLMDHISEFRSFSFHAPGAIYIELFLFIAVLGIIVFLRQRAFGPALLGLAVLHISLYSARHLPTAAVLMLPLVAAALTREARSLIWLHPLLDYSDRLRAIDRRIVGIVPVGIVLIATVVGVTALARSGSVDFNPGVFPVRAADYLERSHLNARVFSKDQWGGYLIYRFGGRTKVFMDGRSDFYGQQLLQTYAEVADVKPAWNQVLKQYDVGVVLIPPDHALASALQLSPDWKRIYTDSVAAIFQRAG